MSIVFLDSGESILTATWKQALVFSCLLVFSVTGMALSFALYHRNYPPIKTKEPGILTIAFFGGFLWWVGSAKSFMLLNINQEIDSSQCLLFVFWFQVGGLQILLSAFTFRFLRLFYVVVLGRDPRGWQFYTTMLLSFLPTFAGALNAYTGNSFIFVGPGPNYCDTFIGIRMAVFVWVAIVMFGLTYLNHQLRGIQRAFNQYTDNLTILALCALLLALTVVFTLLDFPTHIPGVIALTLTQLVAINLIIWFFFGKVLVGLFFEPEEYLRRWQAELRNHVVLPSESTHRKPTV
ncbi:hypothetical protein EDD86DRAFT_274082 [Gorgonomyces haynaldii]|nr:hypothetical protein EDD86DRAFT_274082 [Gorgonomyces haynaldii]